MAHPARAPLIPPERSGYADSSRNARGILVRCILGGRNRGRFCHGSSLSYPLGIRHRSGLSSTLSPWLELTDTAAAVVGTTAIVWLIFSQVVASKRRGVSLAGRLRTKWASIHTDEVYFRDTAHGFLVWAVGLVLTAAFLASAATILSGRAAQGPRQHPPVFQMLILLV